MDVTEVEGKPLLQLLAGSSWESGRFSETLRVLAEKIKRRESFSNLPLEVEIGGQKRWWELSASHVWTKRASSSVFGASVQTSQSSASHPRKLRNWRSEEHTSELQSLMRLSYAVF